MRLFTKIFRDKNAHHKIVLKILQTILNFTLYESPSLRVYYQVYTHMPRSLFTLLLGVLAAFGLTLFNQYVGAVTALPPSESTLGHVFSLVYLGFLLYALMVAARAAAELPYRTTTLFAIGFLLLLPLATVFLLKKLEIPLTSFLALTASNLFSLAAAVLIGAGVGRIVKHPNTLLAAAAIALFFDIVVVTMGTVAVLQASGSSGTNLISSVSLNNNLATHVGPNVKTVPILSGVTIGPADVLFLGFFFASLYLLGHTPPKDKDAPAFPEMHDAVSETFPWVYVFLLIALAIVEFFYLPIPALAPMGLAVIVSNAKYQRFTATEKRDSIIGAIFALFCAVLMVFGARKLLPSKPQNKPDYGIARVSRVKNDGRLVILALDQTGPAQKAGLLGGDVIDSVNGKSLKNLPDAMVTPLFDAPNITLEIERPGWKAAKSFTLKPISKP